MLKKRTRRLLAIIALVAVASPLDPLVKLLITFPMLQLLLIDYDEFNLRKLRKVEGKY